MNRLVVPQGELRLDRYPVAGGDTLRAWDAADEYLLATLAERDLPVAAPGSTTTGPPGFTTVVVNDGFGALAVALAESQPIAWSDSFVSQLATRRNLAANDRDAGLVTTLGSFEPLPGSIDLLLVKVPKSLALLDEQLRLLRPHLHGGTVVIGAAMVKHLHTSTLDVFERRVGATTTSLARKKARLVFSSVEERSGDDIADPGPLTYLVEPGHHLVTSHAGVFSAGRLDIGTRFFLENLPTDPVDDLVDLGCGDGIVGTMAAGADAEVEVTFVDESYRAVTSAEATFRASLGPHRAARFVVGNGLAELAEGPAIADGSVDRVLNNPPFHVDQAVGDAVAWQMFSESRAALRRGGDLWVVGNRHLAYHAKLKRLFGHCDVVAGNSKFVVLRSIKR